MTDAERKHTEKQRAKRWFEDNFAGNACIMCTQLTLTLGRRFVLADTRKRDSTWHPYITVECTNCGHTLFYNAETIGVLKQKV